MKKNNKPEIYLNQKGFLPTSIKKAVIPFLCSEFHLTDENGSVIFSGRTSHFGPDEASGDDVCIADFTAFKECGSYRLYAGGKRSAVFRISEDIYKEVCRDTLRGFYYLRCGCGLDMSHAGLFDHPPCHTAPAVLWEDSSVKKDVTGGWHDAGDYGRYVTAGAVALAHMLYGFKLFPEKFEKIRTNIPDSRKDIPDLLTECRTELTWIMKMQREDGGVYHKATTKEHAPFVMPEKDKAQMYILPVSSMAAADTAAVFALAAQIYEKYDSEFARKLGDCAAAAYGWLERNPEFVFDPVPSCGTGGYGEHRDTDNRCWAAAELYALTGEEKYHSRFKELINTDINRTALGWGEVGGLAALSYITCGSSGKDKSVSDMLKDEYIRRAEELASVSRTDGYGAALRLGDYFWGSNMVVLKAAMTFIIADIAGKTENYRDYAVRQLDYILGCNGAGISYITGSGEYCVCEPHYRPSIADGIDECPEGFVAGGANCSPVDESAKSLIAPGTPPMKCFVDDPMSYSLNEVAIYWNSPAVFVCAYLS